MPRAQSRRQRSARLAARAADSPDGAGGSVPARPALAATRPAPPSQPPRGPASRRDGPRSGHLRGVHDAPGRDVPFGGGAGRGLLPARRRSRPLPAAAPGRHSGVLRAARGSDPSRGEQPGEPPSASSGTSSAGSCATSACTTASRAGGPCSSRSPPPSSPASGSGRCTRRPASHGGSSFVGYRTRTRGPAPSSAHGDQRTRTGTGRDARPRGARAAARPFASRGGRLPRRAGRRRPVRGHSRRNRPRRPLSRGAPRGHGVRGMAPHPCPGAGPLTRYPKASHGESSASRSRYSP